MKRKKIYGYYRELDKEEQNAEFFKTLKQIREGTIKLVPIEKDKKDNQMEAKDIVYGHVYRAKKPKAVGVYQDVDDRQILWVGTNSVQYDSPSVSFGKKQPTISMEKFLKWVGEDITGTLPKGDWKSWDEYVAEKKIAKAEKKAVS